MPLFGPPDVSKLESKRDVQGLIKALGYEKGYQVRDAAAAALERLCTQAADASLRTHAVNQLLQALNDQNWRISSGADRVLWAIRQRVSDPALCSQLHEWFVAYALRELHGLLPSNVLGAVERLGQLGDPRAVKPLESVVDRRWTEMDSRSPSLPSISSMSGPLAEKRDVEAIRFSAIRALGRLGAPAVASLLGFLGRWDHAVRQAAFEALKEAVGPEAVEPLIQKLRDQDLSVRAHAAELLGRTGDSRAAEALVSALGDEAVTVQDSAAAALVRIGSPALQPLLSSLTHANAKVRHGAAQVLDKLGWEPDAGPAGAAYWAATQEWDRCTGLGAAAIGPLMAILRAGSPADRTDVAKALGRIGAPAVEPSLSALADPAWQVRAGAAEALGRLADPRAVAPLMGALSDSQWEARKAAAQALVSLYQSGALDDTQKALLLARRPVITAAHEDQPPSHFDRTLDKHEDYRPASDCTDHVDARAGHTDRPYGHVDEGGIGLEMPF